jgi:hypothetical protein
MAESEGKFHACKGYKVLDQTVVADIQGSVTDSDRWKADKFIKRLALYRYLYPRARISPYTFIYGAEPDRDYLCKCSDKAFGQIMRSGKTGLMTRATYGREDSHAQV